MSKYIPQSWMYNTGFIPAKATPVRERQGLDSQLVSNACVDLLAKERYVPYVGGECARGAPRPQRYDYQSNIVNAEMQNLYPITMPRVRYNLSPIPDNCPCLDFLHEYTES